MGLALTGVSGLSGVVVSTTASGPPTAQSFTATPTFSDDGGIQPLLALGSLTFSGSLPSGWTRTLELQYFPIGAGSASWIPVADWDGVGTITFGVWCVEFNDGDDDFSSVSARARVKLSKVGESDVIGDWQGLVNNSAVESSHTPIPTYPTFVDLNWKRSDSVWNVYGDSWSGILNAANTQAIWRMYDDAESIVTSPYTAGIEDFTDTITISPTVPVTDNVLITYKLMRKIYNPVDDTDYWSSEQNEQFIAWTPAQLANHSLALVMESGRQFTDTGGTTLCTVPGDPVRRVTPRYGTNGQTTSGSAAPRFASDGQYYFNGSDNYQGELDVDIVLLPSTSDPAWTLVGKFTHGNTDCLLGNPGKSNGLYFDGSGLSFYDDTTSGGTIAAFTPSSAQDYVFWLWKESSSDTLHCRVYSDASTVAGSSDSIILGSMTTFAEMGECTGASLLTDSGSFKFKELYYVDGSAITPTDDVGVSLLDWLF